MRVFLSYRRDDTGGRAGRLFDALVARFGARNVFQDVNAVAPGVDFVEHVDAAIETSDATLVVIGPNWLSSTGPDGSRRVDRPDDFVRKEVSTALRVGMPVVPVLVDGATLPAAGDLPEELAPLTYRQAVVVRDESWYPDVDDLIRRLEGETRLPDRRRRWPIVATVITGVLALLIGISLVRSRTDDSSSGSTEPPDCPAIDASWTSVELDADPTEDAELDGYLYDFAIDSAAFRPNDDGGALIVVHAELANAGEPIADTIDDDVYFGSGAISGLLVDGVSFQDIACFGTIIGDPQLAPGERMTRAVGFESTLDPTNAELVLEVLGQSAQVPIASTR